MRTKNCGEYRGRPDDLPEIRRDALPFLRNFVTKKYQIFI